MKKKTWIALIATFFLVALMARIMRVPHSLHIPVALFLLLAVSRHTDNGKFVLAVFPKTGNAAISTPISSWGYLAPILSLWIYMGVIHGKWLPLLLETSQVFSTLVCVVSSGYIAFRQNHGGLKHIARNRHRWRLVVGNTPSTRIKKTGSITLI